MTPALVAFLMNAVKDSVDALAVAHHMATASPEALALTKREVRKLDSDKPYSEEEHDEMVAAAKRVLAGPHGTDVIWVEGNDVVLHRNWRHGDPYVRLTRPNGADDDTWDCVIGWADWIAPYAAKVSQWYIERTIIACNVVNAATQCEAATLTLRYQQAYEQYVAGGDGDVVFGESGIMGMAVDVPGLQARGAALRAAGRPSDGAVAPVNKGVLEA